jgi:hypothetical protein
MPTSSTPTATQPARVVRRSRTVVLASGVLLGLAAAAIFVLLMIRSQSGPLAQLWSLLAGRGTHIASQPTVVERIRQLQRLETVVYTMDKIVSGEKDNPYLPDFLAGDRVLMLVHGEVVAGIDFAHLTPNDITIEGKTVRLRLPQTQIFMTRVDEARTRVYSRQTGWLVKVDPNLETQVRQEAERELLEAALQDGILNTAKQNARSTLAGMLTGLGFEKVEFE